MDGIIEFDVGEELKSVRKIPVFVERGVLDVLRAIEERAPKGYEFSVVFKGYYDEERGGFVVTDDYYIPQQEIQPAFVKITEDTMKLINDGYIVVFHKHPSGLRSFSGYDDENLNTVFPISLLYVDNDIYDGTFKVEIPGTKIILLAPVDVRITGKKIDGIEEELKKKLNINVRGRRYSYYPPSTSYRDGLYYGRYDENGEPIDDTVILADEDEASSLKEVEEDSINDLIDDIQNLLEDIEIYGFSEDYVERFVELLYDNEIAESLYNNYIDDFKALNLEEVWSNIEMTFPNASHSTKRKLYKNIIEAMNIISSKLTGDETTSSKSSSENTEEIKRLIRDAILIKNKKTNKKNLASMFVNYLYENGFIDDCGEDCSETVKNAMRDISKIIDEKFPGAREEDKEFLEETLTDVYQMIS